MAKKRRRVSSGDGWSLVSGDGRAVPESQRSSGRAMIRLRLEKRRGKPTTVLASEGLDSSQLAEIARELRTACATGGGVKGDEIVLQGDHRDRARDFVRARGMQVKG